MPGRSRRCGACSGLGALDTETHQLALLSKDPALRRNAITALGNDAAALQLFFDTAVVQDSDLIVRLAAFNKMVEFEDKETVALAAQKLSTEPANADDEWLSQSLRNAGAGAVKKGPATLGKELIANGSFETWLAICLPDGPSAPIVGTAQHRVADLARTGKRSIEISADKALNLASISMSRWIGTRSTNSAAGSRPRMWPVEGAAHCYTCKLPTVQAARL